MASGCHLLTAKLKKARPSTASSQAPLARWSRKSPPSGATAAKRPLCSATHDAGRTPPARCRAEARATRSEREPAPTARRAAAERPGIRTWIPCGSKVIALAFSGSLVRNWRINGVTSDSTLGPSSAESSSLSRARAPGVEALDLRRRLRFFGGPAPVASAAGVRRGGDALQARRRRRCAKVSAPRRRAGGVLLRAVGLANEAG
mmetsp:Transcript_128989/g.413170  ORF Transcript_128989/g.413170 Transcript_128989/m.413170 type:complete len:204 (+) Transcript_128989:1103-1714(+)